MGTVQSIEYVDSENKEYLEPEQQADSQGKQDISKEEFTDLTQSKDSQVPEESEESEEPEEPVQLKRKYKWKPSIVDPRDKKHIFSHRFVSKIKPTVDLRNSDCMPEVYEQGSLGSCTANALAAAFEYDHNKSVSLVQCTRPFHTSRRSKKKSKKKAQDRNEMKMIFDNWAQMVDTCPSTPASSPINMKSDRFRPSRLFIYWNERNKEGTVQSDSGASLRDGMDVIHTLGVCSEDCWPYNEGEFAQKPNDKSFEMALQHKSRSYTRLHNDLCQLKTALQYNFPVVFGFTVFESFESENVAHTGIMDMPTKNEKVLGGHAVMLCGYDDKTEMFIVRNSWGSEWGDKGYFYMPYEFIKQYASDFWVLYSLNEMNNIILN